MRRHLVKAKENRSQSVAANAVGSCGRKHAFQLVSNRTELNQLKKLQELANNSPKNASLQFIDNRLDVIGVNDINHSAIMPNSISSINRSGIIQMQKLNLFEQHTGGQESDLSGDMEAGPLWGCAGIQVLVQDGAVNLARYGLHSGGGQRSLAVAFQITQGLRSLPLKQNGNYIVHVSVVKPTTTYREVPTGGCCSGDSKLIPVAPHDDIIELIKSGIRERNDMDLVDNEMRTYDLSTGEWLAVFDDTGKSSMKRP